MVNVSFGARSSRGHDIGRRDRQLGTVPRFGGDDLERLPVGDAAGIRAFPRGDNFAPRVSKEHRCVASFDAPPQSGPAAALFTDFRGGVERQIAFRNAREHSLQRVVILLRHRIELVIMAAGAVRREARERRHRLRELVIAILVVESDGRRGKCAQVEGARAEKSKRRHET